MRATQHPSNNAVLESPPGTSHDVCVNIPVTRITYKANEQAQPLKAVRSYWEPTDAERNAIQDGALIVFECWGVTHPPVVLGVEAGDDLSLVDDPR
jgi:hypothetical protein